VDHKNFSPHLDNSTNMLALIIYCYFRDLKVEFHRLQDFDKVATLPEEVDPIQGTGNDTQQEVELTPENLAELNKLMTEGKPGVDRPFSMADLTKMMAKSTMKSDPSRNVCAKCGKTDIPLKQCGQCKQ